MPEFKATDASTHRLLAALILLTTCGCTSGTVSVQPSSAKGITSFEIQGIAGAIGVDTIALRLLFGANLTSLVPTIVHEGASISPASGIAQDFANPIVYTVTAADGSTKTYAVTVTTTAAPSSAKNITSFELMSVAGTIGVDTIAVTLPAGTAVTSLVPAIAHEGASISPASGVAQDFSSPVSYTVTAADGSTKVYAVAVSAGSAAITTTVSASATPTSVAYKGTADITWSSTNSTSCTSAPGGISGPAGTYTTPPLTTTTSYVITCARNSGVTLPSFCDFYRTGRPLGAALDMGAIEGP